MPCRTDGGLGESDVALRRGDVGGPRRLREQRGDRRREMLRQRSGNGEAEDGEDARQRIVRRD